MKFTRKVSTERSLRERPDVTLNKAYGIAFEQDAKTELFLRCATLLPGESKFYADKDTIAAELRLAVGGVMKEDPEFVLKLALFTREELHMRHAPLLLVAEYARLASLLRASEKNDTVPKYFRGVPSLLEKVESPSKYVTAVIQRVDEIPNLVSLCLQMNDEVWKGKLPMMIKKGIAAAFNKFDEYQFGKYGRARGVDVKLRDALFLTHPVADSKSQQKLFDKIADKTLPIPETWEEYIMQHGSSAETWEEIIPRMGYMALLRNLRNFIEKDVGRDTVEFVADKMSDQEQVEKSKQFPFRFYSALNALNDVDTKKPFNLELLRDSVKEALELSAANVPQFKGRSVIFIDVSGSMDHTISGYSSVTAKDIATLYGAIFNKITKGAVIGVFADKFAIVRNTSKDILSTKEKIETVRVGGSTNAYLAFEWLLNERIDADRVFLLSDMQHWDTRGTGRGMIADKYLNWRRSVSPHARLYSIDLVGYGTSSFPKDAPGVATMAGWSEKIFDFARCFEMDKSHMLSAINSVKPI